MLRTPPMNPFLPTDLLGFLRVPSHLICDEVKRIQRHACFFFTRLMSSWGTWAWPVMDPFSEARPLKRKLSSACLIHWLARISVLTGEMTKRCICNGWPVCIRYFVINCVILIDCRFSALNGTMEWLSRFLASLKRWQSRL
ncbi:hypothetical protein AVEN_90167-1 [Araneus ventricosus]|uniref:Uncharacterized protein n=1 Tax=Araneus ventricosus TaxID=182803 RepID=A0A4Y2H5P3_ARAVE|nr:hypothetical protein AVEN_90167-1 [Araneus ventricosus]